jgi:hypothetical protein
MVREAETSSHFEIHAPSDFKQDRRHDHKGTQTTHYQTPQSLFSYSSFSGIISRSLRYFNPEFSTIRAPSCLGGLTNATFNLLGFISGFQCRFAPGNIKLDRGVLIGYTLVLLVVMGGLEMFAMIRLDNFLSYAATGPFFVDFGAHFGILC